MKRLILSLLLSPFVASAGPIIQPYIDNSWIEDLNQRRQFEYEQEQQAQYQQQLLDELATIRAALEQGR